MNNIKEKLQTIIEQAECTKPACKNCVSYKNGGCSFGCVNERLKLTTENYSCDNFNSLYGFNEDTICVLKDLLKDIKRIDESVKNFELLLSGKITEKDFIDIVD